LHFEEEYAIIKCGEESIPRKCRLLKAGERCPGWAILGKKAWNSSFFRVKMVCSQKIFIYKTGFFGFFLKKVLNL
jgi:hypothetical protein